MNTSFTFPYNSEYLLLAEPNMTTAIGVVVIAIIAVILARIIFIAIAGVYLLHKDTVRAKDKQKILSDLVLMKDIQTELEKEIEQATLKAAFQN